MLPQQTEFYKPTTVREAVTLLRSRRVPAVPLAGGTSLLTGGLAGVAFVDLSGLGLDYVHVRADGIRIGAMTTLQTVATAPALAGVGDGLLATAAHDSATRSVRNAATVGGSLFARGPSTDIVVALLALDAIAVTDAGATIAVEELLATSRLPRRGKLVTEVRIPSVPPGWGSALCRVARLPSDQAIVNVAALVHSEHGVCSDIRLAAGGVGRWPVRLHAAERALAGTRLADADIERAVSTQRKSLRPPNDVRGSAEYRRAMVGVLVRRAIRQCQVQEGER
jgi:carbon-monoxide dehydrogenase medium subunit